MKLIAFAALAIATLGSTFPAWAAVSKADKKEFMSLIDNVAADDMAELSLCDQYSLRSDYVQSLLSAALKYPGTDPLKVSALVRQIDRQADALYKMRASWQKDMPEAQRAENCAFTERQARRHLKVYDDFIFKN